MLEHSWIFLGGLATVTTVLTLRTDDDQTGILTGLIGTVTWALWAFSALNIVTHSGGTEFTHSYPALAAFGLLMAVPNLFVALTGPLTIAQNRQELAEEVR